MSSSGNSGRSSDLKSDIIVPKNSETNWVVSVSKKLGRLYYFNSKTGESVWEKPEELIFTSQDLEKLTSIISGREAEVKSETRSIQFNDKTLVKKKDINISSKIKDETVSSEYNLQEFPGATNLNQKEQVLDVCCTSLDDIIKYRQKTEGQNWKFKKKNMKGNPCSFKNIFKEPMSKLEKAIDESIQARSILEKKRIIAIEKRLRFSPVHSDTKYNQPDTSMEWEDETQGLVHVNEKNSPQKNKQNAKKHKGWFDVHYKYNTDKEFESAELYIVLDTNVLLQSLKYIKQMKDKPFDEFPARFIIPYKVLDELDHLKKQKEFVTSRGARNAIVMIHHDLQTNHPKIIGQKVEHDRYLNGHMTSTKADDLIIDCCVQYKKKGYNVVLFTCDKNLITRALMNGIKSVGESDLKKKFKIKRQDYNFNNTPQIPLPYETDNKRIRFGRPDDIPYVGNGNFISLQKQNDVSKSPINKLNQDTITSENRAGNTVRQDEKVEQTGSVYMQVEDEEQDTNILNHKTSSGSANEQESCSKAQSINTNVISRITLGCSKFPKKTPEYARALVSKLKRALMFFLENVFKTLGTTVNEKSVNARHDDDFTHLLEECLCRLQLEWSEVIKQPLSEEDIICIRVLKNGLLKPVEDITWTIASVQELMDSAIKMAERFRASGTHVLTAISFTLALRDCQDVEHRLKHEITEMEVPTVKVGSETDVLLAQAALDLCWSQVHSFCNNLSSDLNSKKENPQDQSEIEGIMENVSTYYGQVSEILEGLSGVLNEDISKLSVTHGSIQLLYNTLVAIIPDSTPLEIDSSKLSGSENEEKYFMVDLSAKCILAYCSQQDKRTTLVRAKESFSDFSYKISQCYDDYCGVV